MSPRSGVLAAWTNAFVAGHVSLDQVIDATTGADARHCVRGLGGYEDASLQEVVVAWRRAAEPVRLVLPVPGDVRGLPSGTPLAALALEAGEAAVGGGFAIAPTVTEYHPSSAPTRVMWQALPIEAIAEDYVAVADAQQDLATAIRETATALTAADVAGGEPPAGLADARRSSEHLHLPPGHPQRAIALLAQAERMQAVLDLALADPSGGAYDRFGMSARDSALRPLATAVRRARVAGYNAR